MYLLIVLCLCSMLLFIFAKASFIEKRKRNPTKLNIPPHNLPLTQNEVRLRGDMLPKILQESLCSVLADYI